MLSRDRKRLRRNEERLRRDGKRLGRDEERLRRDGRMPEEKTAEVKGC